MPRTPCELRLRDNNLSDHAGFPEHNADSARALARSNRREMRPACREKSALSFADRLKAKLYLRRLIGENHRSVIRYKLRLSGCRFSDKVSMKAALWIGVRCAGLRSQKYKPTLNPPHDGRRSKDERAARPIRHRKEPCHYAVEFYRAWRGIVARVMVVTPSNETNASPPAGDFHRPEDLKPVHEPEGGDQNRTEVSGVCGFIENSLGLTDERASSTGFPA